MAVNEKIRDKALDTLTGMSQIVKNEMLIRGEYVTPVRNRKLADEGAICGGRKACAIGSLWIAAGVKVEPQGALGARLPGIYDSQRPGFLRRRPGLRLAYEALNEAAEEYAVEHNKVATIKRSHFDSPIEALFESRAAKIGRPELLSLINVAKRKVRAA